VKQIRTASLEVDTVSQCEHPHLLFSCFRYSLDTALSSLHTLPTTKHNTSKPVELINAAGGPNDSRRDREESGISKSTATIPRLISVVEIIKREYLKTVEVTNSRVISGLYQYNEIGYLEEDQLEDSVSEEDRTLALAIALNGKNHPKEKKSAYMRVTLSKTELPHLIQKGTTLQAPSVRKLPKSAWARARKRQRVEDGRPGGAETIT